MFKLIETKIKDDTGKAWATYGISYNDTMIKDISIDKAKIEKLVSLCNELDLSPKHIYDVIEDFLVDFEI